jgi:ABC-2 type transport system permease protein
MSEVFAGGAIAPFQRMRGVYRRHFYLWARNPEYFFETFWQPVVDVLIWGFISYYIARTGQRLSGLASFFLSGVVLFAMLRRGQHEVTFSFMEEAWSRNLQNILMTPIGIGEYVVASVGFGLIKMVLELLLMAGLLGLLFHFNVFILGLSLVPFGLLLLLTGWALGLAVNAAIVYFGRGLVAISWIIVFVLQPFSCVFYPLAALPGWAQWVARGIPATWVFEGMRTVLSAGPYPWTDLAIALGLNIAWLAAGFALFGWVMKVALDRGLLTKLEW